jgi:nucleotide-binding universal stress UspA family protein
MSYKTILVQVEDTKHLEARAEAAAEIALKEGAHLVGLAITGVSRFLYESLALAPENPDVGPFTEALRQRADAALKRFEHVARKRGVTSIETQSVDDESSPVLNLHARCSDLVVLGQPDPDDPSPATSNDFPEYVVMNSGGPGLIIPFMNSAKTLGERVLIGWNAGVEVTRAVHFAMPLLRRARLVEIAIFNPEADPESFGMPPGADLKVYLARQNVSADLIVRTTDQNVGEALLSVASNVGSDLLVMGFYGHSRFREILLGGTTRNVFRSTTIPVLTAH